MRSLLALIALAALLLALSSGGIVRGFIQWCKEYAQSLTENVINLVDHILATNSSSVSFGELVPEGINMVSEFLENLIFSVVLLILVLMVLALIVVLVRDVLGMLMS